MSWRKRLIGDPRSQAIIASLLAAYLRLVYATTRWEFVDTHHLTEARAGGRAVFSCFWHGRLTMIRYIWRDPTPFHMLQSQHRDGRLMARIINKLGVLTIRGSVRRSEISSTLTMVRALKAGDCVAITPDGPRGPRMRAKAGVVVIAQLAGVPILPVSFGVRRRIALNSWDRLVIPLPFNRGVFIAGAPIAVGGDREALRLTVEAQLNELTARADRLAGVPDHAPRIEPAPLAAEPLAAPALKPNRAARA